jgi:nucleotide-binding universal stress UspA family protein
MTASVPEAPFKRILVPVDGSDHGFRAARAAAGLARVLGARLTLLTVYHAPSPALGEPNYSAALNDALTEAQATIESARRAVREAGGPEPEAEWLGGAPVDTIISAAEDGGYDLIVMGTHGRGRLQVALLGSVSNAVSARAGRSVLLVGATEPGGTHAPRGHDG